MKQNILFILISLLLMVSCGTKKNITEKTANEQTTTEGQKVENETQVITKNSMTKNSMTENSMTKNYKMDKMDFNAFLEVEPKTYVQFKLKKNLGENWLIVQNGEEQIKVEDYTIDGDKLTLTMPIFGSTIDAQIIDGNLHGIYSKFPGQEKGQMIFTGINNLQKTVVLPQFTDYKLLEKNINLPHQNLDGKWSVTFSPGVEGDEYPAIGEFHQKGNDLSGTFLTETGDYRFLAGKVYGNDFYLSCFDGSHAFLFTGNVENGEIKGEFLSGTHWREPFVATPNPDANLTDPYKLTYIKEGYKTTTKNAFDFNFPNLDGQSLSLQSPQFENKAVVVQIFGTWCPNCMDETELYTRLHKEYKSRGIEFVGVAFERGETLEAALPALKKYQSHFGMNYPLLFGGKASKKLASEKFPMLNKIISFPTTIVLNRQHEVVKIHTGFNGPATSVYEEYEKSFRALLESL